MTLSRTRPFHKNDNPLVEEKNGSPRSYDRPQPAFDRLYAGLSSSMYTKPLR